MQPLRRPMALLLLVWYLPACSTYHTTELTPEAVARIEYVSVTVAENAETTTMVIRHPQVSNDSLGGVVCSGDRSRGYRCPGERSAGIVPLSSVLEVKAKKADAGKTILFVMGAAALVGGFVFAVGAAAMSNFELDLSWGEN